MRVNILPNSLIFDGVLDENSSVEELTQALNKLKSMGAKSPIILDFSKVLRANSSGVLVWLRFLKHADFFFKYVNAPVWLVSQFNMIRGYFDTGSYVESFQVPYYAPGSQISKYFTINVGTELPVLGDYSNFELPKKVFNGEEFEIDFEPNQYFHFISQNVDSFKSKLEKR